MADVQDPQTTQEPSMEEILASIRKIISDESEPPAPVVAEPAAESTDGVIELTQMVKDDGSVIDLMAEPVEEPPAPAPVEPMPEPVAMPDTFPPALSKDEALISEPVASAATSALSSLASTLEIERLASAPSSASYIGNGARTLEDMVIELMRPLLKQWLEQNLPATVDRLVQKEIERISRRAKD